jgi:tetratricopeptide (TPR) repeat protein
MMMNRKQRRALAGTARREDAGGGRTALSLSSPLAWASEAATLLVRGETGAAERLLAEACARFPQHAELRNDHAHALVGLGRVEEALGEIEEALRLKPFFPEAWVNFGSILLALGRREEALFALEKAVAMRPDLPAAHLNYANALSAAGDAARAEYHYRAALSRAPDQASVCFNYGTFLITQHRPAEAVPLLGRAVALSPADLRSRNNFAIALKNAGRLEEAEAELLKAWQIKPDHPDTLNNLGTLHHARGRLAKARACYEAALAADPGRAEGWCNLGTTLSQLGELDAAAEALRRALALKPFDPRFWRQLAELIRFTPESDSLSALRRLIPRLPSFSTEERIEAHFALGKAESDAGRIASAFAHYRAGNALKRALTPYDEAATLADLQTRPERFPRAFLSGGGGIADPLPVFIVGMPRSGTTLVEQILASLPGVTGGDELSALDDTLAAFPPPETLDSAGITALAADYLHRLRRLAPEAQRFTNKVPLNFRHLGLIHRAWPEARIIHVVRDPVDTCFSCYTKLFTGDLPFTYELSELGRFYRSYERLMDYWRTVLPPERFLEIRYETLVADLEGEARRLAAFCGVPWDPSALDFHRTRRPVRTASAAQVRRPLFTHAIGRARAFAPYLGPLFEALGCSAC